MRHDCIQWMNPYQGAVFETSRITCCVEIMNREKHGYRLEKHVVETAPGSRMADVDDAPETVAIVTS